MLWKRIEESKRNLQQGERWERIRNARYNVWYKWIKEDGVPEYLRRGWDRVDGGGWRNLG